ncbi:MAG TPA: redoxin domain-containing protein [Gemmatimonadales bacterium]|nr:redoxin domain-containing protein [Gemmatimonadales bacterium]
MEAYRDQYATLFKDGKKVVVIGISVDADTTLQAWMHDEDFPFVFVSDKGGAVGRSYGAYSTKDSLDVRYLFVIDPAGKITHVMAPFHVIDPANYAEMKAAVDSVTK